MNVVAIPETQKVLIQPPTGFPPTLSPNAPLPALRPGQILVRVHAVALNPTDYKMPTSFPSPGAVCGCDFAGQIAGVGVAVPADNNNNNIIISNNPLRQHQHQQQQSKSSSQQQQKQQEQQTLKPGDAVFGAVHGSNPIDHATGAFAEFVAAEADLVCRVPKGMKWEQAAAWGGIGWGTLGIALWEDERGLGLKWPWGKYRGKAAGEEKRDGHRQREEGEYVLINGGATATGTLAVQLLRLAGYRPITTCSPNHESLLQSLGAVSTFDYNSPSCASTIRAETSNRVRHVLDCIADTASVQLCYAAMSRAGGRYACLELPSASSLEARKAVRWRFVMGYEVFGREIALGNGYGRDGKDCVEHRQRAARWAEEVQGLVQGGWLKGHAVEVLGGRWEESVPKGLERLKRGDARGVKLVARIAAN